MHRFVRPLFGVPFGLHHLDDDTVRISNNEVNVVRLRRVNWLCAMLDRAVVCGVEVINLQEDHRHRLFGVFKFRWFVCICEQCYCEVSDS